MFAVIVCSWKFFFTLFDTFKVWSFDVSRGKCTIDCNLLKRIASILTCNKCIVQKKKKIETSDIELCVNELVRSKKEIEKKKKEANN